MGGVAPLLFSANSDSDAIFKVAVAHLCKQGVKFVKTALLPIEKVVA